MLRVKLTDELREQRRAAKALARAAKRKALRSPEAVAAATYKEFAGKRAEMPLEHQHFDVRRAEQLLAFKKRQRENYAAVPFGLVFVVCVMATVLQHSAVSDAYSLESSLIADFGETVGDSDGSTTGFQDVEDYDSAYQWLSTTLLPAILVQTGLTGEDLDDGDWGFTQTYNRVIGAVRVSATQIYPEDCELSSYRRFYGDCYPIDGTDVSYWSADDFEADTSTNSSGTARRLASAADDCSTFTITDDAPPDDFYIDVLKEDEVAYVQLLNRVCGGQWLTRSAAELKVELGVFNGELSRLGVITLTVTFDRGGAAQPEYTVSSVAADPYFNAAAYVWDTLFLLCVTVLAARQVWVLLREWRAGNWTGYFEDFWNLFDSFIVVLSFVTAILWQDVAVRAMSIDLDSYAATQGPSFDSTDAVDGLVSLVEDLETISDETTTLRLQGMLLVLCSVFRMLRYFRFQPRLALLTDTLAVALQDLLHFFILLALVLAGFVIAANVLFGAHIESFSTLSGSTVMAFNMLIGDFDYEGMEDAGGWWGTVIFWVLFVVVAALTLLNVLLAIVLDAYADVKEKLGETSSLGSDMQIFLDEWRRKLGRGQSTSSEAAHKLLAALRGQFKDREAVSAGELADVLDIPYMDDAERMLRVLELYDAVVPPPPPPAADKLAEGAGGGLGSDSDDESDDDDEEGGSDALVREVLRRLKALDRRVAELGQCQCQCQARSATPSWSDAGSERSAGSEPEPEAEADAAGDVEMTTFSAPAASPPIAVVHAPDQPPASRWARWHVEPPAPPKDDNSRETM